MFNHLCDGGCNFDKAAQICEENGGHLPFIQNSEENDEILVTRRAKVVSNDLTFNLHSRELSPPLLLLSGSG